jgi:type IV pilus assembly protein PilV
MHETISSMKSSRSQRGITLIEVLIALLLVSIGLLGMASLQANSLKFNRSAYTRTQATQLAYDIADRMRANRDAALAGNYDLAMTNTHTATSTIADQDLTAWMAELTTRLPNGSGSVVRNNARFTISLQWSDDLTQETDADADGDITGEAATMVFAFETEL